MKFNRLTDICSALTAVDTLRTRNIHEVSRITAGTLAATVDDDFTIIIGERAGFACSASRGKCCANSRVDSKIELPTSRSGISRDAGAENANAPCIHTERPAFVYAHEKGSHEWTSESLSARFATFDVAVFYQLSAYSVSLDQCAEICKRSLRAFRTNSLVVYYIILIIISGEGFFRLKTEIILIINS